MSLEIRFRLFGKPFDPVEPFYRLSTHLHGYGEPNPGLHLGFQQSGPRSIRTIWWKYFMLCLHALGGCRGVLCLLFNYSRAYFLSQGLMEPRAQQGWLAGTVQGSSALCLELSNYRHYHMGDYMCLFGYWDSKLRALMLAPHTLDPMPRRKFFYLVAFDYLKF